MTNKFTIQKCRRQCKYWKKFHECPPECFADILELRLRAEALLGKNIDEDWNENNTNYEPTARYP